MGDRVSSVRCGSAVLFKEKDLKFLRLQAGSKGKPGGISPH